MNSTDDFHKELTEYHEKGMHEVRPVERVFYVVCGKGILNLLKYLLVNEKATHLNFFT